MSLIIFEFLLLSTKILLFLLLLPELDGKEFVLVLFEENFCVNCLFNCDFNNRLLDWELLLLLLLLFVLLLLGLVLLLLLLVLLLIEDLLEDKELVGELLVDDILGFKLAKFIKRRITADPLIYGSHTRKPLPISSTAAILCCKLVLFSMINNKAFDILLHNLLFDLYIYKLIYNLI